MPATPARSAGRWTWPRSAAWPSARTRGSPDLVGFGRRALALAPQEAEDDVLYQLGAVAAFCRAAGVPLVHAKMHGALSTHVAERSPAVADAIVAAVRSFDAALPLVVLPASELAAAAARAGHPIVREGFPERGYARDGRLLDRSLEGRDHPRPRRRCGARGVDGSQRRVRDPLHPRRQPARGRDRGGPAGGARPRRHRRRPVLTEDPLYVRCADVQGLGRALLQTRPLGVRDVHPVFATIAVTWDPARIDRDDVVDWIRAAQPAPNDHPREVRLPVGTTAPTSPTWRRPPA